MAIDDLWFSSRRTYDDNGRKLAPTPTKRHGRGKRYRVRYVDDLGAPHARLFADKEKGEAERFDAAMLTDVFRGTFFDPKAGRETVGSYADRWREAQLHRPSSAELIERSFRRHVLPVLGHLAMNQVRPTHVQSWVKNLDLSPNTVRAMYGNVASMFNAAVRDRVIPASPCIGISLPELPATEHVIPTPEQVHALAAGVPARYRAAVYIGAGCGLRLGETLGLELRHLNLLRRELVVEQQMTVVTGRTCHLAPPKTRTSRRTVEVPKVTAAAVAQHLESFPAVAVPVEDDTDARNKVRREAELLFTNTHSRPVHHSPWSRMWAPVASSVGLPERTGYHSLRHYFATLLIHNGASVKTVQLALGHSSPAVTLQTYVGLWPDQIDRTRTLVDEALGITPAVSVAS